MRVRRATREPCRHTDVLARLGGASKGSSFW
jgi:hypothetical protein